MVGERFGPYVLEALIGQGGMGEVHRAVDTRKDRVVAVKRLPAELAADEGFQARFRRESQIAARLQDLHVIPIHDYGETDGRLFIEMPLIDGVDLATLIERRPEGLAIERAVGIVAQVAGALDTAHTDGLVHRDVKPSNVLLRDDHGADFAYLIDFGIARGIGDGKMTATGAAVGTLAYMAPERFDGPGDHRGDVYALACVLFEALCGRAPFLGHDLATYVKAHSLTPPPRPSLVRPGLPAGWDEVIAKGMAKDPARRYQRAGELASAARTALQAGHGPPPGVVDVPTPTRHRPGRAEPLPDARAASPTPLATVTAPPAVAPRPAARPWRWVGWAMAGVAAAMVVALLVTALAFTGARGGSEGAVPPSAAGPAQSPSLTDTITVGDFPTAVAVSPDGTRAYITNTTSDTVSIIDTARPGDPPTTVDVGSNPRGVAVSPDGTRAYVTNEYSHTLSIIDTARPGDPPTTVAVGDYPRGVAFSPDGTRAYVTNFDTVSVIDAARPGDPPTTVDVGAGPWGVAVSPDGTRAYVTNSFSNTVSIIDTARLSDPPTTITVGAGPRAVAVSPDGTRAYVTNFDSDTVSVIDTARPSDPPTTITVGDYPEGVAVSPDGTRAYVTRDISATVSIIDTARPSDPPTTITVDGGAYEVAFSPDGTRAYITNYGSDTVSIIDTGSG